MCSHSPSFSISSSVHPWTSLKHFPDRGTYSIPRLGYLRPIPLTEDSTSPRHQRIHWVLGGGEICVQQKATQQKMAWHWGAKKESYLIATLKRTVEYSVGLTWCDSSLFQMPQGKMLETYQSAVLVPHSHVWNLSKQQINHSLWIAFKGGTWGCFCWRFSCHYHGFNEKTDNSIGSTC